MYGKCEIQGTTQLLMMLGFDTMKRNFIKIRKSALGKVCKFMDQRYRRKKMRKYYVSG